MKNDLKIEELIEFIENFQPGASLSADTARTIFKIPYKQYHVLLVWGLVADKILPHGSDDEIYFRECISDIAHGILLTLFNFYKPARMCMRSAAENFARFLTFRSGKTLKNQTSYELMAVAREFSTEISFMKKEFDAIAILYSELCLTVHSAKPDYMALRVPFKHLTQFDGEIFASNLRLLLRLVSSINRAMFCLWREELSKIDHKNADFVKDGMSPAFKRNFFS